MLSFCFGYFVIFEMESNYVAQASFNLVTLLSLPSQD